MPEVKRPVRTIEVTYMCDSCGKGMLHKVGDADEESGDSLHECVICGHQQTFQWVTYPRIDYIGEDEDI